MRLPGTLSRLAAPLLLAALAVPLWPAHAVRAATDDDYDYEPDASRVGRISRLEGDASLKLAGSNDWQDADANAPIFEGDEVYTGDGCRMEIQLGGGRYLRLDERTDVTFAYLDEKSVRVEIPVGTVIASVRHLDRGESFQISAPAAAVAVRDDGVYRVDVDGRGNTRVVVQDGRARVSGVERAVDVDGGESARFSYDDPYDVDLDNALAWDGFDSWSEGLDRQYDDNIAQSSQYVGSLGYRNDIYGLSDLAGYGSWIDSGSYGYCWVPNTGYGWQPYSNGYWQWYPGYGYTWISNDPWGWAPYHYGRWTYLRGYGWAWVPWSQFGYGNYYWSPAQVYWYQYPGYNGYAWVPLAPGEPYIPYSQYRRFDRRHDRDFIPRHLREGRGIGVTQPGSSARLKPARGGKFGDLSGRTPIEAMPDKPTNVKPDKPRLLPRLPQTIATRPVVVDKPANTTTKPGRGPVVERRPTRVAVGDTPDAVIVKPQGRPKTTERPTPARVEERPLPQTKPERRPVVTVPDRSTDNPPETRRNDRPKQERVERQAPPPKQERVERQAPPPKVERVERQAPPPRQERQAPPPKQERQAPPPPRVERVERQAPAPRVERQAPPPKAERQAPPPAERPHRNKP